MFLIGRLSDQVHAFVRAVGLEVALDGNHNEIVLRFAENAAKRPRGTDYLIWISFDLDCFANGIDPLKEAVSKIIAHECDHRVAADFFSCNRASRVNAYAADARDVIGDALDVNTRRRDAFVGNSPLPVDSYS